MKRLNFVIALFSITTLLCGQQLDLSGAGWKACLDTAATWQEDELFLSADLPSLTELPVNEPTGGWSFLVQEAQAVNVPMTIDEYFFDGDNTSTYHGVSWVWRQFRVSDDFKGKIVKLKVEKASLRAEVYINQKLAAYDVVGETPFEFDVSPFFKYGEENTIAVRLTNPGGRRGWFDFGHDWGEYTFKNGRRDFSTLGHIGLEAYTDIYVQDVFVKNEAPVNSKNVKVDIQINNTRAIEQATAIKLSFNDTKTGKLIHKAKIDHNLEPGLNTVTGTYKLDKAKLWSPDSPQLYTCNVEFVVNGEKTHYSQDFGVRTFEVYEGTSGAHNFYLNGKRLFYTTSIDWGFYAPQGDYATPITAKRSVEAAKAMKINGLSFHRSLGEPLVMQYADELGLCIYEEPGGFHEVDTVGFSAEHMKERIRRMVLRDRNHPSVIVYNLSNEDHNYNSLRKECLELIHDLDDSRLIVNSSGIPPTPIPHIRPYEDSIRTDYRDHHTAANTGARYNEDDFFNPIHRKDDYADCVYFLGEVNSVTGPDNWYKVYESIKNNEPESKGYDTKIYEENYHKSLDAFERFNMKTIGSGNIQSPGDISVQAGRGMMYIHARHAQSIMSNNNADGLALNGWTSGPQSEGDILDWASGILDEGRFMKGPVECYTHWTKPLQVAIARKNGKYFNALDTVFLEANFINQGKLDKGSCQLEISIVDGSGNVVSQLPPRELNVRGGDVFAQGLDDIEFKILPEWQAGYLTVQANVMQNAKILAQGSEQILLKNRPSMEEQLKTIDIEVLQWNAADSTLADAGYNADAIKDSTNNKIMLVGDVTTVYSGSGLNYHWNKIDALLDSVAQGAIIILRFDKYWAEILYQKEILSTPINVWGGNQTPRWLGSGWGYIDHFVGDLSVGNNGTIGTNAWEVPSDPLGFYPFESQYKLSAYGLYLSRPWECKTRALGYRMKEVQPTMAVTLGAIDYGKGKIVLMPCYQVDEENAFSDMLFFNTIMKAAQGDW